MNKQATEDELRHASESSMNGAGVASGVAARVAARDAQAKKLREILDAGKWI